MSSPIPFAQWGIDLLGSFPKARGRKEYLVMAVDCFTRQVEVKALKSITSKQVQYFSGKISSVDTEFQNLITDNVKQFNAQSFQDFCEKLNIEQQFASIAHSQTNGPVQVTKRTSLRGLKKCLEKAKGNWVEELPSVLRSYRTRPRKGTGESSFCLCFGVKALILAEIGSPSWRNM